MGLTAKYRANLKQPPKIGGYVDTQSLRIRVSDPHIQLFQGYCFEVEGYSAITSTLVVSGEPQGRLRIS